MVDTNQEPVEKGKPKKKKKESPKKAALKTKVEDKELKTKGEDKGVVKRLPVKKENAPVKKEGAAKSQGGKAPVVKKQTAANLKKFLKGAWSELKKVHWPNRRELVTYTTVVLTAVLIVAVLLFVIDAGLSKLLAFILQK
ncbi:MAG: preprotein translocase subunit SecE [Firmicutes bacterium HGW-Firmicutes-8]|nr:MAG: preprotein translocase subunit SecE [Firmicutes bacterium HGW-Firmicutes-8]